MPAEIFMPTLGMNQDTGKIIEWLAQEGQEVTKGQPVMVVETDKATVELEAPATGKLVNVTAKDGDEVPVGQVIALIVKEGEAVPAPASPVFPTVPLVQADPAATLQSHAAPVPETPISSATPVQRVITGLSDAPTVIKPVSPLAARIAEVHRLDLNRIPCAGQRIQKEDVLAYLAHQQSAGQPQVSRIMASPKARRLAREHNLDLHGLPGSGPVGAVLAVDVINAVAAQVGQPYAVSSPALQPTSMAPTEIPTSRMWQVMAQRLTESWQTIPHFYLQAEADATQLRAWRAGLLERMGEKVTFTDLIFKLVAVALRKHPRVNACWVDGTIHTNPEINIGLAVAVEDGLLVPVLRNADQLGIQEIVDRRKALVAGAQAGRLSLTDLSGGTFTISNLGMYGIDVFNAIINPPEAAILSVGQIVEKVVPVNRQPVIQPRLTLVISCDHRVIDGARAAQFLQTLTRLIENPLFVLD